jgi:D-alanyl-D-alanine carboxypeptidase/D-alanyl-D-alanine-endopeptidase (penicillin-binding protein 4)
LATEVVQWLKESSIDFKGNITITSQQLIEGNRLASPKTQSILEYKSPPMDKIVYWFMRKSVNLYGETLIKTLGKEKNNNSSFESGIKVLKDFWKSKGINTSMINFADGSGLSPQNYVSARAEVQALLWATKQAWYSTYWESFPTYNNMKMKSGTIKDSKAYAGYHTSKEGKKYVYAIIVNNYSGNDINGELFRVLNVLK